jgi:hypothetical protein
MNDQTILTTYPYNEFEQPINIPQCNKKIEADAKIYIVLKQNLQTFTRKTCSPPYRNSKQMKFKSGLTL